MLVYEEVKPKILFSALIVQICFCYQLMFAAPLYDIVTYHSDPQSLSQSDLPQDFEELSTYHHLVKQNIRLENDKQINCFIPTHKTHSSKLFQSITGKNFSDPANIQNLTVMQSKHFLDPLKDLCAYYRTTEFLWEFCYKKYFKQFDDELTIIGANKKERELFYLGFSLNYNHQMNQSNSLHFNNSVQAVSIEQLKPAKMKVLICDSFGLHRIRIVNNMQIFDQINKEYHIYIKINLTRLLENPDYIINPDKLTVGQAMQHESYIEKFLKPDANNEVHILRQIKLATNDSYLIVNPPLPFILTKAKYDIIEHQVYYPDNEEAITTQQEYLSYMLTNQIQHPVTQYNCIMYLEFMFCPNRNSMFLSRTQQNDSILLSLQNIFQNQSQIIITLNIRKVISDNLLQFYIESDSLNPASYFQVTQYEIFGTKGNMQFSYASGAISILGNLVFGVRNTTHFVNQGLKKGDIFMFNNHLQNEAVYFQPDQCFLIKKVVSNNLLILEKQFLPMNYQYGVDLKLKQNQQYLIGKQIKPNMQLISQNSFNKEQEIPIKMVYLPKTQLVSYLFELERQNCTHYYQLMPNNQNETGFDTIITFSLQQKAFDKSNSTFTMFFSHSECDETSGIEISLLSKGVFLIRQSGQKSNYEKMNSFFDHTSLHRSKFWITLYNHTIRLGISSDFSLSKQLLAYKIDHNKNMTLRYFHINSQLSSNIEVINLQINALSSSLINYLDYLEKHPRFNLDSEVHVQFSEDLKTGTVCEGINKARQTRVIYRCSESGNIMSIQRVEEPSTCKYELYIETYLLCPPSRIQTPSIFKDLNQIICFSD